MSILEKKEIVWAVREEWASNENGFDSEEIIYETMRKLIKDKLTSEKAFENFKLYYISNKEVFTKKIIHELIEDCHQICNADNGKNKSELILLAKLHKLFLGTNIKK
ncbi:hypothetical protein [uncultured Tenacibaculum sp.]|uniref:hypothetical protein n=1 Tax=uncultured Tenacibaculum sp. TaxID=174713 RepID=UPI00262A3DB5|nr:hypothetical protein [uncultured Tenacibaculum sp.]